MQTGGSGLLACANQRRRWRGRQVGHLEVGMEGGQVKRDIRAQMGEKPVAEPVYFFFRVVLTGNEEGSYFYPNLCFLLEPSQGVENRPEVGEAQSMIKLFGKRLQIDIGRINVFEEGRSGLGGDLSGRDHYPL